LPDPSFTFKKIMQLAINYHRKISGMQNNINPITKISLKPKDFRTLKRKLHSMVSKAL